VKWPSQAKMTAGCVAALVALTLALVGVIHSIVRHDLTARKRAGRAGGMLRRPP
jgi:chloramphenicol 3-O-phosphotransferase